jgi:tRNA threonylcarbamoyladenosine biosynthesis protein TsaB
MIFAVDTAADCCSLALRAGDRVETLSGEPGQTRLEQVMPLVHRFLGPRGGPAACEAFAFGAGPGAFTGLRVACSVAQGFGFAFDRPLVPVGNLEALAHLALCSQEGAGRLAGRCLVAIDARMGEVYWAVYEQGAAGTRLCCPAAPATSAATQLRDLVGEWQPDILAGNGFDLGPACEAAGPVRRAATQPSLAGAIALLASERLRLGLGVAARDAVPTYVRDRVARTVAERAAGMRVEGQAP